MMDVHCYQYLIGKDVGLEKLDGVPGLTKVDGAKVMQAQFGSVTVLVFETGEVRAFIRSSGIEKLKNALPAAGVKIMGLLQAIKAKGVEFDENAVLAAGKPMAFDYLAVKGVRPELEEVVNLDALRELVYAPYSIMPEFQLERNAVQGGENEGRKLAQGKQDKEELNSAIVKYLRDEKLGIGKVGSKADESGQSQYEIQVFTVHESAFAAGMPVVNKALCNFIRGVVRGAYVAFMELENIEVKESHCWGLGDTYCEFEMRVTPM